MSLDRQTNSGAMPNAPESASSPGASSCGAMRLVAVSTTGPREVNTARPSETSPAALRLAPMAKPFFVVAGEPSVFRSGMSFMSLSVPLFPAETKTIESRTS